MHSNVRPFVKTSGPERNITSLFMILIDTYPHPSDTRPRKRPRLRKHNHRLLPRLLAPRPDTHPVWRLHHPHLLARLHALLQNCIHATLARRRRGIGRGNRRARRHVLGVVGRDWVVGGGAVGGAERGRPLCDGAPSPAQQRS